MIGVPGCPREGLPYERSDFLLPPASPRSSPRPTHPAPQLPLLYEGGIRLGSRFGLRTAQRSELPRGCPFTRKLVRVPSFHRTICIFQTRG